LLQIFTLIFFLIKKKKKKNKNFKIFNLIGLKISLVNTPPQKKKKKNKIFPENFTFKNHHFHPKHAQKLKKNILFFKSIFFMIETS
jgi:hypothetical protein